MRALTFILLASLAIGCGGNNVDIQGDDPVADAREVTAALCEKEADCGDWDVDCVTTTTGTLDCTATHTPGNYSACEADELQDAIEAFMCAGNLSASEIDLVEDCVNAITDMSCISQSEMDNYVAALERGEDPPSLRPDPSVCEALDPIFERCQP